MLRYLLVFVLTFTITAGRADATALSNAIVKTFSYPCADTTRAWQGSGLVIKVGADIFVLTSDHTILAANGAFCHHVHLRDDDRDLIAVYMTAEPALGLALLKLKEPSTIFEDAIAFDAFPFSGGNGVSLDVSVVAYPRLETHPKEHNNGVLIDKNQKRPLYAGIPTLLEVKGAFLEYGMSGGALLTAEEDSYLGMISDRVLFSAPQNSSQAGVLAADTAALRHGLAIPAAVVKAWLSKVFSEGDKYQPFFARDTDAQLLRSDVWHTRWQDKTKQYKNLTFQMFQRTAAGDITLSDLHASKNFATLIAAANVPGAIMRGGADGIGGPDADKTTFVRIKIDPFEKDVLTRFIAPNRDSWLENRVMPALVTRDAWVDVPYFVRQANANNRELVYFDSLGEFFALLQDKSLTPALRTKEAAKLEADRAIISIAETIKGLTEKLTNENNNGAAEALLSYLKKKTSALIDDWQSVEPADFRAIESPVFKDGLRELILHDFATTSKLRGSAQKAADLLVKMKGDDTP